MSADDHTVLKFRPRRLSHSGFRGGLGDTGTASGGPDADDYRQRMITNAAAFAFATLLACIGIWLAIKLADIRVSQDCVLMGRRDCAHLSDRPR